MKNKRNLTILKLSTFYFPLFAFYFLLSTNLSAQNVIITDDNTYTPTSTNALLEVKPGSNDKGVLIPRLTSTERTAITMSAAADKGLLVYDTDTKSFWYYDGTAWVEIGATSSGMADDDGDTKIQVEESADEDMIRFDVGGAESVVINNNSRVGIGTGSPAADLHIVGTEGFISEGTYNSGNNLSISGAGTRMVWYPKKAAFRAGSVNSTQWDNANIGLYSFATGRNTFAFGHYSTAMGENTIASGVNSIAMGENTTASGAYSTAMGYNTEASGEKSTAMGYYALASGENSIAMGENTTACGNSSTAMGENTTASGDYSTAMGYYTEASGLYSTAMGAGTSASGAYSTAMGYSTDASGEKSTAMGYYALASGNTSTAMGLGSRAQSYSSTAIGRYNIGGGASTSWVNTDPIFEIGIGSDAYNRANAVTVLKNGNVGIGTNTPTEKLEVVGAVKIGAYTLPSVDGSNGQRLTTDGSGNVSWSTSSGSGYWTANGGNIYRSTGNVGIGTDNPQRNLHISSSGDVSLWLEADTDNSVETDQPELIFSQDGGAAKTYLGYFFGGNAFSIIQSFNDDIQFFTDSTFRMAIKADGKVGIGTSNPSKSLEVTGEVKIGAYTLPSTDGSNGQQLTTDGNGNVSWSATANHWSENGGSVYRSTGNVGIGTSNPGAKLEIAGTSSEGILRLNSGDNSTGSNNFTQIAFGYDGNAHYPQFIRTRHSSSTEGNTIDFYTGDGTQNGTFPINAVHGMTIENGKVGIGTTSPSEKLEVDGNILQTDGDYIATDQVRAIDGDGLKLYDDGGNGIFIKDGGDVGIGITSPGAKLHLGSLATSASEDALKIGIDGEYGASIKLFDDDDEASQHFKMTFSALTQDLKFHSDDTDNILYLDHSGNVGIGTASPSCPLEIDGSSNLSDSYGFLNSSGSTGQGSGSNPYSIKASDRIMASEFNAVSDQRIKTNINSSNISTDLEKVKQLRLTQYNYIDSISKERKSQKGFIAQEVEKILPEAVNISSGFVPDIFVLATTIKKQEDKTLIEIPKEHKLQKGDLLRLITPAGQIETEVTEVSSSQSFTVKLDGIPESIFVYGKKVDDFRAVNYDYIFSTGIGAIQELSKQNEELKAEISSLKSDMSEIKTLFGQTATMNDNQMTIE